MVRQAHHERNQQLTVRPEPVEGLDQRFPNMMNVARMLLRLTQFHAPRRTP